MTTKVSTETVNVEKNQYLPLPETSEYVVAGPARVQVARYDSGSVTVEILEGQSVPTRLAIARRWTRLAWGV